MPTRGRAGHAAYEGAAFICAIALQFTNVSRLPNVPSVPAQSITANLPRGLLLVEEYGALAVAIKSALRKFAPLHTVKVASSFTAAAETAAQLQPELFVLDLDPPPPGAIKFLIHLQADHPDSRVLVLAAGSSLPLCSARGKTAALHFVEKPFDLPEFGAAVQQLIAPWNSHLGKTYGTIGDLDFVDLAQVICISMDSTALLAATPDGRFGEIHLRRGQIIHAETPGKKGVPALEEIAGWSNVRLSEIELGENLHRTIEGGWAEVLLPFARRGPQHEETQRKGRTKTRQPSAPAAPPPAPVAKRGQKILVIDDTDMLLIFVADVLSTFNPNLQITTAATGAEGFRIAREIHPDLILLDYSLTDTTGDQVCRQLLAQGSTAQIPVLMMSGHFSELMRTAEDYPNVVDALPKPFLSGALISAVQRALANGPVPKISSSPETGVSPISDPADPTAPVPVSPPAQGHSQPSGAAAQTAPEAAPPPKPDGRTPLPNGHGPQSELPSTPSSPSSSLGEPPAVGLAKPPKMLKKEPARETSHSSPPSTKVGIAVIPPPRPGRRRPAPVPGGPIGRAIGPTLANQTELRVTFCLEVAVVELNPILQVDSVRLQPVSRSVAVQFETSAELKHAGDGVGFELGPFQLGANGKIETLCLTPTRESIQLPESESSLRVATLHLHPADAQQNLELVAAQNFPMQVQLTAAFELVRVELSAGFEVKAIFIRGRGDEVLLRNRRDGDGTRLELREIEVDPTGELRSLVVRTIA